MRVVYSAEHLHRAPLHEVSDGRAIQLFETPERAETIKAALGSDGGLELEEPAGHGHGPIRPCTIRR